jgi:hypothetical protein
MPISPLNLVVENTKGGSSKYDENGNKMSKVRKIRSRKYLAYGESKNFGSNRPHSVQRQFNSVANH